MDLLLPTLGLLLCASAWMTLLAWVAVRLAPKAKEKR